MSTHAARRMARAPGQAQDLGESVEVSTLAHRSPGWRVCRVNEELTPPVWNADPGESHDVSSPASVIAVTPVRLVRESPAPDLRAVLGSGPRRPVDDVLEDFRPAAAAC
jgi:hypothetical protein